MQGVFDDNYITVMDMSQKYEDTSGGHRASCHRCGNIRKNVTKCTECPHVFCKKCTDKMLIMDGPQAFMDGCPLCKDQCCCGSRKSHDCTRQFHCYKKCLRTRVSPRARTVSPRVISSANGLGQISSSSENLAFCSSKAPSPSAMEDFMRDYTDSEEEGYVPSVGRTLPSIDEDCQVDAFGNIQQIDDPSGSRAGRPEDTTTPGVFGVMRPPMSLAPIDTSFVSPSPRGPGSRSKAKSSRGGADTPTKRSKLAAGMRLEEELLNSMNISLRQACYSPQPPFNSGIPSIFSPHSLTPETNPFFLQSAFPSSNLLPPIRTLLQSDLANPFVGNIPTALRSEMQNVQFQVPAEVEGHVYRSGAPAPDPALGYGFTFVDSAVGAENRGNGLTGKSSSAARSGVDGDPFPVPHLHPAAAPAATGVTGPTADCISTPNIDRACAYLLRRVEEKGQDRGKGAKDRQTPINGSHPRSQAPPQTASQQSARLSQQEPPLTPVSGLFCTPIATEGNNSGPGTQRSQLEGGGSSTSYDWTGESIASLHHLGVDVLTPAGLPQCTPMTVEPTTTPTAEGSAATVTPRAPRSVLGREPGGPSAAYPMYVHDPAQYSAQQTRCHFPQYIPADPPLQHRLRSSAASAKAAHEGTGSA